ncbi:cortactin-binding protein 2 isoform X3 [Drosophila hydei]|uniref:Cortactin-binding protein 2 isoform X3 n=1 Tax=Drosophila hydei TaxID=7224 RepID=A0A6J1LLG0_DROHY|nr:cortactin-binding protein 2 isoform X3 [Drosophila hydei]
MSKKQSSSNKPLKRSRSKSSCDEPVQKQKCKPIKAATKQADDKAGKNGASIKGQRCNKSKIIAEDKPSQLPRRSNRKTSQHLTEACVKTETRKKKRHSTDVSVGQQLKKQEAQQSAAAQSTKPVQPRRSYRKIAKTGENQNDSKTKTKKDNCQAKEPPKIDRPKTTTPRTSCRRSMTKALAHESQKLQSDNKVKTNVVSAAKPEENATVDQPKCSVPAKRSYRRLSQLPTTPSANPILQGDVNQKQISEVKEVLAEQKLKTKIKIDSVQLSEVQSAGLQSTNNSHAKPTSKAPSIPSNKTQEIAVTHKPGNNALSKFSKIDSVQLPEVQSAGLQSTNHSQPKSIQLTPKPTSKAPSIPSNKTPEIAVTHMPETPPLADIKAPAQQTQTTEQTKLPSRRPSQYLTVSQYMDQRLQNNVCRTQTRDTNDSSSSNLTSNTAIVSEPQSPVLQSQATQLTAVPSSEVTTTRQPYRRPSLYTVATPSDPQVLRSDNNQKQRCQSIDLTVAQPPSNKPGSQPLGHPSTKRSYGPPSQLISGADLDTKHVLYIRDLSVDIVHHQVFELFSSFGNLKRVYVLQRSERYKYAMMFYLTEKSLTRVLTANPHKLNGKAYFCHKAGPWHLGHFKCDRLLSECINRTSFRDRFLMRLPYGVNIRTYLYESHVSSNQANSIADPDLLKKSALLPPTSLALLHYLRKKQSIPKATSKTKQPPPNTYEKQLFAGMGKNYKFERHSYTNFVAYQKQPGHYETVPTDYKVGLTALAYADLRDKPELISFFYH